MLSEVNKQRQSWRQTFANYFDLGSVVKNDFIFSLKIKSLVTFLIFWCGFVFSCADGSDLHLLDYDNHGNGNGGADGHNSKVTTEDVLNKGVKDSWRLRQVLIRSLENQDIVQGIKKLDLRGLGGQKLIRRKRSENASFDKVVEGLYYTALIYHHYGDEYVLSFDKFDALLSHIGLEKMTKFVNETDHHDHGNHSHGHGHHHEDEDHEGHDHEGHDHEGHDHGGHDHEGHDHGGHDHSDHKHAMKRRAADDDDPDHSDEDVDIHDKCVTSKQLLYDYGLDHKEELNTDDFLYLCPALIHKLNIGACSMDGHHDHGQDSSTGEKPDEAMVWLYAMVSVFIISLCALFGILCIPKQGRTKDNLILQFLIALAMGSMSGDGVLHLIPHAMVPHGHKDDDGHDHDVNGESEGNEDHGGTIDAMYKGVMVLVGIYGFFFMERTIAVIRARKDARQKRQKNSYGMGSPMIGGQNSTKGDGEKSIEFEIDDAHGHSHTSLFSCTSLAMVIIVGDMFHNFCDGLAIGAAFAGSISVGFSTSIAVFCHELPHEIGDFAVLISSGMSRKKAIFFNLLSTVPCFLGAAIGLELGSLGDSALWIFALVGGMFLYISLVDLVPEMTKAYVDHDGPWKTYMLLHWLGLLLGVVIMLVLGIYEGDLQRILT